MQINGYNRNQTAQSQNLKNNQKQVGFGVHIMLDPQIKLELAKHPDAEKVAKLLRRVKRLGKQRETVTTTVYQERFFGLLSPKKVTKTNTNVKEPTFILDVVKKAFMPNKPMNVSGRFIPVKNQIPEKSELLRYSEVHSTNIFKNFHSLLTIDPVSGKDIVVKRYGSKTTLTEFMKDPVKNIVNILRGAQQETFIKEFKKAEFADIIEQRKIANTAKKKKR